MMPGHYASVMPQTEPDRIGRKAEMRQCRQQLTNKSNMNKNFLNVLNDESEDALSLDEIKGGVKTYGIFGCCFINQHCNKNTPEEEDLKGTTGKTPTPEDLKESAKELF